MSKLCAKSPAKSRQCKCTFKVHLHRRFGLAISLSDVISIFQFSLKLQSLKESWTWMMWMVENSNFSHFLLFPSRSIDMFFPFNFWKYHIEVKHYHRITLKTCSFKMSDLVLMSFHFPSSFLSNFCFNVSIIFQK